MYANLKTEMAVKGVTIEAIAELLGIHRNSVSNKINGNSSFTIEEAVCIKDAHFRYADMQYLFRKENPREVI
jgi:plasmid maintenance system antidote protein VapI